MKRKAKTQRCAYVCARVSVCVSAGKEKGVQVVSLALLAMTVVNISVFPLVPSHKKEK